MPAKISNSLMTSIAATIICSVAPAAQAEVLDADAHGFTIRVNTMVQAERMAVYKAAVDQVGGW